MPLSLDSIRNLAGTGGILYSQKDGLQSVGTTQRLKSFFDVGDARQKNAEPAGGYARYDYDTAIDAFEDKMHALFDRLGDGPGDKEVLSACIKSFRDGGGGGGLKAQDKLERIVDQFKANLDESRALGAQYGEQTRLDVVEMLKTFGRPIKTDAATPAPIRTIVETGHMQPLKPDSYEEYEIEIKFPSQNLDHLARIDWGKCPYEPVAKAEEAHAPTSEVVKLVADDYKFTGTTTISFHANMDWDYSVQLEDVQ